MNSLVMEVYPRAEVQRDPMDRPHITQPQDLMELAASGFVEFNLRNEKDEYVEKFYTHDFVAAARELGYEDIEHTEAITILEIVRQRAEQKYREAGRDDIEQRVTRNWLENLPLGDTFEEFITLFESGQLTAELAGEFGSIVECEVTNWGITPVFKIYDELFENDFHRKIQEVIREYRDEKKRLSEYTEKLKEDVEQGEDNE